MFLRGPAGGWGEGSAEFPSLAPRGLGVPGQRTGTCSVPHLASFLLEKLPPDIGASGAQGDVVKADVPVWPR